MSKTKRFDIHHSAPEGGVTFSAKEGKFAGSTNTKRKIRFGITPNSPVGEGTIQDGPPSHIKFPHASTKPGNIVVNATSGQGHYAPSSSAIKSGGTFAGRPGIGKSSPKKGSTITKPQGFRK